MDENNSINQEPLEKQKLEQLEKEMESIGNKTTQDTPLQSNQPVQQPEAIEPPPPVAPEVVSPQGLKKSKGILWVGIILLILSLVGVGAYYLGFRNSTSTPSTTFP